MLERDATQTRRGILTNDRISVNIVLVILSNSLDGDGSRLLLRGLSSLKSSLVGVELNLVSVDDGSHGRRSLMPSAPRSRRAVGSAEEEERGGGRSAMRSRAKTREVRLHEQDQGSDGRDKEDGNGNDGEGGSPCDLEKGEERDEGQLE